MTVTHNCPASARLLPKALPKGGAVIPAAAESETGGSSSLPLGFFEVAFFMGFYMRLPRLPLLRWQQHASQPLLWIQATVVASRFYQLLYGWRSAASGDGGSASGLTASLRGHRAQGPPLSALRNGGGFDGPCGCASAGGGTAQGARTGRGDGRIMGCGTGSFSR